METLSGVFPKPSLFHLSLIINYLWKFYVFLEVPPKRNFINENRQKLKELQKQISVAKPLATTHKPIKKATTADNINLNNKKLGKNEIKLQQQNIKKNFQLERARPIISCRSRSQQKIESSKSTKSRRLSRSCSSSSSKPESVCSSNTTTTKDSSSQTVDINDELFLKDVIIRIPSASVLRQLENGDAKISEQIEVVDTTDADHVRTSKNECDDEDVKSTKQLDDHDLKRNAHIDKLREFSQKNFISKTKKTMYLEGSDQQSQTPNKSERRRRWFDQGDGPTKELERVVIKQKTDEPEIIKKINVPECKSC